MSKYVATLEAVGFDADGTEWNTYRVLKNGIVVGCVDLMPSGVESVDASIIADMLGIPDGETVTIIEAMR